MAESTILDNLATLLKVNPNFELYRFIDKEGIINVITPAKLDLQAKKIAAQLQSYNSYKKTVIILYEPGCDYIFALFACLYAGAIPIPAYPPLNEEMAVTLKKIISNSGAEMLLTSQKININLRKLKVLSPLLALFRPNLNQSVIDVSRQLNRLKIINTSRINDVQQFCYLKPDINPEDIAYIQYTSGSTNAPKGVVITHANLVANLRQLHQSADFSEKDIYISWLPPYHDMGLVSGVFLPLFVGYKAILFSPITFLQNPLSWLQAISDYQGTVSGGPDFAYRMLTNKISVKENPRIDLSSWRVAFCGAETVNPDTFPTFYNKFSCYGLRPDIFAPCYGLAEGVLYVCGVPLLSEAACKKFNKQQLLDKHIAELTTDESNSQRIVGVGFCPDDTHIVIVDPESQKPLPEGAVGEIWFHGPNAAEQYWNNPTESEIQLNAKLNQLVDDSNYRYVRTGDLGFKYANELFLTGRIKDLIIINGFNHYAQDIEFSVRKGIKNIRLGNVVAFAEKVDVDEHLIILAEIKEESIPDLAPLRQSIRELVIEKHFIFPKEVFFVEAKKLPKTTSGKLKRVQCREDYLKNKFDFL